MKWDRKLKLVMGLDASLFLVILCNLLAIVNSGLVEANQKKQSIIFQRRQGHGQHRQSRQIYVHHHRHMIPSRPAPHLPTFSFGSPSSTPYSNNRERAMETVRASVHPLNFPRDNQKSYNTPPHLYANGPPGFSSSASSPAQYSGYFYAPEKHHHHRKPYQSSPPPPPPPAQPFYSNAYNFASNSLWEPVARPSISSYHPHAPLTHPTSSSSNQHFHAGPPTSGPVTSASLDTYNEAMDLFSEVVKKLEKEPGNGYGIRQPPPTSFSYPQSILSNGIHGASLSSALSGHGFPHQLDNIMGPEFRHKAQKLYNKIIKEQNDRLSPSPQQSQQQPQHYHYNNPYHSSPPPIPNPMYSPAVPHHHHHQYPGYGGLSYLEGMIHGSPAYGRPSQYARKMVDDNTASGSSVVDTVKSLEVSVPNGYGHLGGVGNGDEFMMTSDSNLSPQISQPPLDTYRNNHFTNAPPLPPPVQFSQPLSPSSAPEMTMNQPLPSAASTSLPSNFPRSIPLNENDFIEHPLPYEEYEGLIKDIAINHNY